MSKNLIIFFSRNGENYYKGMMRDLPVGNTEVVANFIKDSIGADMFKVETVNGYSPSYNKCIEEVQQELRAGTRPALKDQLKNVDNYDNIFVGYPIWWGTMPMGLFTQLEALNLSGKTIIPFATHEGSGLADSVDDIKKIASGATIKPALAMYGSRVNELKDGIIEWAQNSIK